MKIKTKSKPLAICSADNKKKKLKKRPGRVYFGPFVFGQAHYQMAIAAIKCFIEAATKSNETNYILNSQRPNLFYISQSNGKL